METNLLRDIMSNVKLGYKDGRPPHHHPSARQLQYNSQTTKSCIYVVDYHQALRMTQAQLVEAGLHRDVLVTGCPYTDQGFTEQTFSQFISMRKVVEVHGELEICELYMYLTWRIDMAKKSTDYPYVEMTVKQYIDNTRSGTGIRGNLLAMTRTDEENLPLFKLIFMYFLFSLCSS